MHESPISQRSLRGITPAAKLRWIRALHTFAWAVFAGSILAFPVLAWLDRWRGALLLILLVFAECMVLLANRMQCPLTGIAARHTDDRRDNFDIYLPLWLARQNKRIFGTLYAAGLVFAGLLWWARSGATP